jgi:16S rRNA (cytosine967-C5)-methyltransferase
LRRLGQRAERAGARVEIATRPPPGLRADVALVDAPCSELGILRRGPDARFRIEEPSLGAFPALQREILEETLRSVRAGGRMVYATCTIRSEENEEVARAFEREHPGLIRNPVGDAPDGFFRTFPHREGTDAFFAARWTVSRGSDAAR